MSNERAKLNDSDLLASSQAGSPLSRRIPHVASQRGSAAVRGSEHPGEACVRCDR